MMAVRNIKHDDRSAWIVTLKSPNGNIDRSEEQLLMVSSAVRAISLVSTR